MNTKKIALLTCWYGPYPWYFPYFIHSCGYNPTIDFIIITENQELIPSKPDNVKIVYKTLEFNGIINTRDYSSTSKSTMIARNFGVTLSYKFGQLKDQIKKVQKTIQNDDVKGGGNQGGGQ